jgi:hypothetical protein
MLGLDARGAEVARALGVWALAVLPPGALLTRRVGRAEWTRPVERFALAALVGLPVAAFVAYLLALVHADALVPATWALGGVLWLVKRPRAAGLDWTHPTNGIALALVGLAAFVSTREFAAYRPGPGDTVVYDHSIEQAIHVAFSWEALRGVPFEQLPTAAGLRFPHYHALSYLPVAWAARWGSVDPVTVHHALIPPLVTVLLSLGLSLVLKARTGRDATALAAAVALPFVVTVAESLWVADTFRGRVPLEFLLRSTSGAGGTLVFTAVAALLAVAARRDSKDALVLAAGLAGIAYGVKAQMFLLLGGAFALSLLLLAWRERRREPLVALAVMAACALPLAVTGRTGSRLGTPHFEPGLFARECGFGPLLGGLGSSALWLVGGPLALWSILRFSPFAIAFGAACVRRWRSCPPVDLYAGAVLVVALAASLGLAAEELQRGEVSTLLVREGLFAVQVLVLAVDVGVAAWLLGRVVADGPRAALVAATAATLVLLPVAWSHPLHRPPAHPLVLGSGEQGALAFLRDRTPLDSVVAHLRGAAHPDPSADGQSLHPMPVVAALAGRRTVLEYYRPDVDRSVNRHRALRRLFATEDAAEAESLLDRFGVDYVLEYASQPLRFHSARLAPVYEAPEVRVWHFAPANP